MEKTQIENKVRQVLEFRGRYTNNITLTSIADLDILFELEDFYSIEIPDYKLKEELDFDEFVDVVYECVGRRDE